MRNKSENPAHYSKGREIQPIDVIEDMGFLYNFCIGNVIKYVMRAGRKGDAIEDLKKAKDYIERAIHAKENNL